MRILRAVQDRYPSARLELGTEGLTGASDALREGRVVVASKFGIDVAKLELAPFCSVRIVPVARADHPVAMAPAPVLRALLRAHAQIVLSDSPEDPDAPSPNVIEGGLLRGRRPHPRRPGKRPARRGPRR